MTIRWFTDDAKDAPAAIRSVFIGLERASFTDILAFAHGSTASRNELMRCVDPRADVCTPNPPAIVRRP